MRLLLAAACLALPTAVAVPAALAEPLPYRGPHPLDLEGRWHEEDSVHVHDELAVGQDPFATVDGVRVFLADPVAYGWEGPVWAHRGVHPLPARIGEYCGIEEEHRHPFPPEGRFTEDDGVYRYVGALRGGIPQHRPGRVVPAEGSVRSRSVTHRDGSAMPLYHPYALPYAPSCVVVTERVGDTTTTFVTGHPACSQPVRPVRRRHPLRPGEHRHVHPEHRRHRDRSMGRDGETDMGTGRRGTDPERPPPRRSGTPASRRGR